MLLRLTPPQLAVCAVLILAKTGAGGGSLHDPVNTSEGSLPPLVLPVPISTLPG